FISYEWPGNVRQLQNVLRNVVVLNSGKEITLDMLPPPINTAEATSNRPVIAPSVNQESASDQFTESDILPLWESEK
ncbi:sigma-54-dependent Fis family transcriptional regulator, partial [Vibrio campbellii]